MNRKYILINTIALALTVAVNYLSNTGYLNGETMSTVSSRYENLFTPAGYAFSIWGLIYFGLAAFLVYLYRRTSMARHEVELTWWFVLSCLANMSWVIAWLYLQITLTVILMVFLLVCLLRIVKIVDAEVGKASLRKRLMLWMPFSIYSGWVTVALIANMAAWLTKLEWNRWGLAETAWAYIMISIAVLINLFMMWSRRMTGFNITGAWALSAIAVANWNAERSVSIWAITGSVILLINIIVVMSGRNRRNVTA